MRGLKSATIPTAMSVIPALNAKNVITVICLMIKIGVLSRSVPRHIAWNVQDTVIVRNANTRIIPSMEDVSYLALGFIKRSIPGSVSPIFHAMRICRQTPSR